MVYLKILSRKYPEGPEETTRTPLTSAVGSPRTIFELRFPWIQVRDVTSGAKLKILLIQIFA
jgi:hypothetical protein